MGAIVAIEIDDASLVSSTSIGGKAYRNTSAIDAVKGLSISVEAGR